MDLPDLPDLQALLAQTVQMVQTVLREELVLKDPQDKQAPQALLEREEKEDFQDRQVLLDLRDPLEIQVHKDLQVLMGMDLLEEHTILLPVL
jgi:hypothetical protein